MALAGAAGLARRQKLGGALVAAAEPLVKPSAASWACLTCLLLPVVALEAGAASSRALPVGALPEGALPVGALPAGALPAGALPAALSQGAPVRAMNYATP